MSAVPSADPSASAGTFDTASPTRIELALISHTNAGKTSLARTLLGKDIGEVRDAPHVTELAEPHTLLATQAGDELRLWDTPGFGDSARLMKRLRVADNPIGWLLREVWDKYRDRPFWCSQQAVRAARDAADVVLYLVNAAEDPRDAGYVAPEMQVLRWVGRPIIVLLNQTGPPRPQADEAAEIERWRDHLAPLGDVTAVLALDAFARCWVQEAVLLDAVARALPDAKRPAMRRLRDEWSLRNRARFEAAMRTLARQLVTAAREREPLPRQDDSAWQKLLRAVGVGRDEAEAARTHAMAQLAQRLDAASRAATEELIALHDLHGSATQLVLERLQQNYRAREPVSEAGGALLGSVLTGALTGLKADLAAGGMTLGAGLLVGGIVGGLAGAGAVRGINALRGEPDVRWSEAFLDGLVRSSVLRYLAVAHFGRGRGRWVEGEAPAFWQAEVEDVVQAGITTWHALWQQLRESTAHDAEAAVADALATACTTVLRRLYPATRELPAAGATA
jgi:hypothetical protein